MYQSRNDSKVYWFPQGAYHDANEPELQEGWYFYDEVDDLGGGPYSTERMAIDGLTRYCEALALHVSEANNSVTVTK